MMPPGEHEGAAVNGAPLSCITQAGTLGHEATCTAVPGRRFSGDRGIRGRVDMPGPTRLIAATDGSWKQGVGGYAYVTHNGHWALGARKEKGSNYHLTPHRDHGTGALVMELRAVALVIKHFPGRAVRFLIDSESALGFLRAWQAGEVARMPAHYSLRPRRTGDGRPALVQLAAVVAERDDLRFVKVTAHDGHPMNEVADGLASIARRAMRGKLGGEEAVGMRACDLVTMYIEARR